jgi:hypothetical protein
MQKLIAGGWTFQGQLKQELMGGISAGSRGKVESREIQVMYLGHRFLSYLETILPRFL